MRVTLIQDDIYLPSMGGGIKANRCLLEELARAGHHCTAIARACTRSPDGPRTRDEFHAELTSRALSVTTLGPDHFQFEFQGVRIHALDHADLVAREQQCTQCVLDSQPDCVLVADDKRRYMLASALAACPERVVLLLQTIVQMPFGPLSLQPSESYHDLMRRARAIIAISHFEADYLRMYGGFEAMRLPIPVYGRGPFSPRPPVRDGFVTMINPCEYKGLTIFLALADRFPQVSFAAVPTWGASEEVLASLASRSNVTILDRADDIQDVLESTRILLAPSLWPETFGYVVPEAMLRGIPVIASRIGGLPEAKLGVDYLVDVVPGQWRDGAFVVPPQDIEPWAQALTELVSDNETYARCASASWKAAHEFLQQAAIGPIERLLLSVASSI